MTLAEEMAMHSRCLARSLMAGLMLAAVSTGQAIRAETMEWTIAGEKREAVVLPPSRTSDAGAPVILVFHGHGGTMRAMERKGFQDLWPEAIVVCPQGLPTVTGSDPEGKRPGWQQRPGDPRDRDLKFVDAILKTLREKYQVDDRRIYATGHSNGGGLTYLLWARRGQVFAAIAPVATMSGALLGAEDIKPLPVLHIAGRNDRLVPFDGQERVMEVARKLDGCAPEGEAWASAGDLVGTVYPSRGGTPVVWVVHPGTHRYPDRAPELIVRFFKEHARQ
jgi:polyhydroxybutyrate depolymerase